jgi:hypothetical protein
MIGESSRGPGSFYHCHTEEWKRYQRTYPALPSSLVIAYLGHPNVFSLFASRGDRTDSAFFSATYIAVVERVSEQGSKVELEIVCVDWTGLDFD